MTRAILCNFRNYTSSGKEFYEPILDFFLASMKKYEDEYDHLYLLDSNWDIDPEKIKDVKATIIKVNSSLGYVDTYKSVLPQVKEDIVLFLDNDMVVYEQGRIDQTFRLLDLGVTDVVTIFDTIGEFKTDKMGGKNKFCPYWFAVRKEVLQSYRDIDWNSHMPHSETLGYLTQAMLNDSLRIYEWEEDKSNILFDGAKDPEKGKDLGYYHIRAGSTIAYLLATKKYGDIDTYNSYLKNQPKSEILRHLAWYCGMISLSNVDLVPEIGEMIQDLEIQPDSWLEYMAKFKEYHGL